MSRYFHCSGLSPAAVFASCLYLPLCCSARPNQRCNSCITYQRIKGGSGSASSPVSCPALSFHARLPVPLLDHWLPWEPVWPIFAVRHSDSTSWSPRRLGPSSLLCRVFLPPPLLHQVPSPVENQGLLSHPADSQPSGLLFEIADLCRFRGQTNYRPP